MNWMKAINVWSWVIVVLLFGLSACDSAEESVAASNDKYYFDLTGLLNREIAILERSKPLITKVTKLNDESETIQTNAVDWKKELELFLKFDINKPAYKNSYTTSQIDSVTTEYNSLPSEKLLVKNTTIVFDNDKHTVKQIHGLVVSENKLYESTRRFDLHFRNGHLISYAIAGYQKLILMDKRPFDISVNIQ